MRLPILFRILRITWFRFFADRCLMMAAALAYQVLFATIPLTALLAAALGLAVRLPEVRAEVIRGAVARIPLDRGLVIDTIRTLSESRAPLTWIGAALLLWTSVGIFAAVRDTLNVVWRVRGRGFVHQKLVDLGSILALAILLMVSIAFTIAFHGMLGVSTALFGRSSPGLDRLSGWIMSCGPVLATFAAFVLVYRYVPNTRHRVRDVLPGAVAGAALFEAAKHGFTWYVARFSRFEMVYGALGAVMLFQLWIYLSSLILLLGAELNLACSEVRSTLKAARVPSRRPGPPAGSDFD